MSWLYSYNEDFKDSVVRAILYYKGKNRMKRFRVDLEKLIEIKQYFKIIEEQTLQNIDWYKNGEKLRVTEKQIKDFRFIGLSVRSFPEVVGWIEGIKVTSMSFYKEEVDNGQRGS